MYLRMETWHKFTPVNTNKVWTGFSTLDMPRMLSTPLRSARFSTYSSAITCLAGPRKSKLKVLLAFIAWLITLAIFILILHKTLFYLWLLTAPQQQDVTLAGWLKKKNFDTVTAADHPLPTNALCTLKALSNVILASTVPFLIAQIPFFPVGPCAYNGWDGDWCRAESPSINHFCLREPLREPGSGVGVAWQQHAGLPNVISSTHQQPDRRIGPFWWS